MAATPIYYTIALPTPLRQTFDYVAEEAALGQPGCRVRVSFGRQTLVGIIVEVKGQTSVPPRQLKTIDQLLDTAPALPAEHLRLCQWAADYYHHPLGEVLAAAVPVGLRQGEPAELAVEPCWQLTEEGQRFPAEQLKQAPRQRETLEQLQQHARHSPYLWHKDLLLQGLKRPYLQALSDRGLITELQQAPALAPSLAPSELLGESPLPLNPEQQVALDGIDVSGFGTYLLYGATGSGKTEIYLQLIEKVLQRNQQALVLIPEIGLTPQTLQRFQKRFHCSIAVIHSGLSDSERKQAWLLAAQGLADIVIGTRSAIFTPLARPGVLIIDEEHDASFKQQDGFRYSARDLAVVRSQQLAIPLLLGSATPSLESLHNAERGRYRLLPLHRRAGGASAPQTSLLDIRKQPLQQGFSTPLLQAMAQELQHSNQVLVFINRRGFSPALMCHDCGWMAQCPACDARLTVHSHPPHLHCHHCDHQRPLANQCPECHSLELRYLGQGTERAEQFLQEYFSETPVIRIDRDTTRGKNAMTDLLQPVHEGEPCILVGTQMLAKGHHFPGVTLVAVLDIDNGLYSTDFRGPERAAQLLVQVSGRAGRAEKAGQVIIQTHLADHPLLQTLLHRNYQAFAQQLLQERQQAKLPPFGHLVLIRAESKRPDNAWEFLSQVRASCNSHSASQHGLRLLGPLPAPMEKRNDRYRYQLQLLCQQRRPLHEALRQLIPLWENFPLARRVRWSIDVDPADMT